MADIPPAKATVCQSAAPALPRDGAFWALPLGKISRRLRLPDRAVLPVFSLYSTGIRSILPFSGAPSN